MFNNQTFISAIIKSFVLYTSEGLLLLASCNFQAYTFKATTLRLQHSREALKGKPSPTLKIFENIS
jgi:hypothetical protein